MSPHSVALAVAKLISEGLYVDDGALRPCLGNTISPQWVQARANNIATAICGSFDVRPLEVAGEIESPPVRSRYGFEEPPRAPQTDDEWNDPRISGPKHGGDK